MELSPDQVRNIVVGVFIPRDSPSEPEDLPLSGTGQDRIRIAP